MYSLRTHTCFYNYMLHLTLTVHNDIHSTACGSSREWAGGYTGVYSCSTLLDIHDLKGPLITDHNTTRTEPLHNSTNTRSGVRCITIQVQCISFIEDGIPSDYWRPEDYIGFELSYHDNMILYTCIVTYFSGKSLLSD